LGPLEKNLEANPLGSHLPFPKPPSRRPQKPHGHERPLPPTLSAALGEALKAFIAIAGKTG
jgi:hypothetical protein